LKAFEFARVSALKIASSGRIRRNSLLISLLAGNSGMETGSIRPVTPFMIMQDASCSCSILLDRLLFLGARADLVRVQAAGKIRGGERARRYRAITDRKPHLATGLVVKIRVRSQERLGFDGRCIGEAIDIMVAISLSVGEAVEGDQRSVLLDANPRLAR